MFLFCATSSAFAQNAPSSPSDAPPRLERLEEGAPAETPPPKSGKSVKETRDRSGAVNEIEVKTGVSTYYLRPDNQVGNAQPGDLQSGGNRAAQYRIKEFDLGRKKAAPSTEALPVADETVTPPTTSTNK